MKPGILLATTCRWPSAALLALAFAENGSRVELVCPQGHPAAHTRTAFRIHVFQRRAPLPSLRNAIEASEADLIIPCDDEAMLSLHRLQSGLQTDSAAAARVLDASFGTVECHRIVDARSRLIDLARSEGIRVPETAAVATVTELKDWLSRNRLPAVLKADESSGGVGVQNILTDEAVELAFKRVTGPPAPVNAGPRTPFKPDSAPRRRGAAVNVQSFIEGRDATSSVACWKGEVVASIHCEVLKTLYSRGPASLLRLIDNHEMDNAARRLIKRLGLSGIHGFDFRLDVQTGNAYLIEMNARATQISHLAMGPGRNLPAALHAMLSGNAIPETKPVAEKDVIALFPQEWNRDPSSEYLLSAYHDVPWREPRLVKYCVDNFLPHPKNAVQAHSKHLLRMLRERTRQQR